MLTHLDLNPLQTLSAIFHRTVNENRKSLLIKELLMAVRHRMSLVQFSSVAQSCPTVYDPMSCSASDLPVQHQLPEPTQTYVHCIGDAILPSHPLSSPYPPAFSFSQHPWIFGQDNHISWKAVTLLQGWLGNVG